MRKVIVLCVTLSSALILQACQTPKHLASVDRTTICLALAKADPLSALSNEDRRTVRELFSREGKDALKMARALRKEIGCI